jgi:hypothetical protein
MKTIMMIVATLFSFAAFAQVDLSDFDHLDPQHVVPTKPLKQALTYFKTYKDKFPNQRVITVIDFTQHSSKKRMYIVDLKTGAVERHIVSHGQGSDPKNTGYAKIFSNEANSHASSLGFYRTAEVYTGKHGKSLRLDGLSPTNSKARERAVVIHAASYVQEGASRSGRSWGCPAVDPSVLDRVVNQVKAGSLLYIWAGQ